MNLERGMSPRFTSNDAKRSISNEIPVIVLLMTVFLTLIVFISRHIRYIIMTDILNISESQARVLRAIAYYEADSGKKGATQYLCYNKVPNKLHVSGSTFNDNIKYLEKNLLVKSLEGRKKKGERATKPYTITDLGQVAWLRFFPLTENIEIIKKVFPNILLSQVDDIFDEVDNPDIKYMKNKYALGVLGVALDSFHINEVDFVPHMRVLFPVELELFSDDGIKTSFIRHYQIDSPAFIKKLKKRFKTEGEPYTSFDEEISVIDSITFLFYYNLISYTINADYKIHHKMLSFIKPTHKWLIEFDELPEVEDEEDASEMHRVDIGLMNWRHKIDKKMQKLITSNKIVSKIFQDNLKDLSGLNDTNFYNISKSHIKGYKFSKPKNHIHKSLNS